MKKLLFVLNPAAGKKKAMRFLSQIMEVFGNAGYMPTVLMTTHSGHATEICAECAGDYELVVCAGGDGTLNETISGVLKSGANVPIAYLPCGTTNDLATTLGLNKNLPDAALDAVGDNMRCLDIGRLNDKTFVYTASFGAFTHASYATPQAMKNALGHFAYVLEGAKEVMNLKPIHAKITSDAGIFEGDYIFGSITNSTSLAGIIKIDETQVSLDDGVFEMMLVENPENAAEYSKLLNQILAKRFDDKLRLHKVTHVEIETDEPLDWTLDGEQCMGDKHFVIDTLKQAIALKIPRLG